MYACVKMIFRVSPHASRRCHVTHTHIKIVHTFYAISRLACIFGIPSVKSSRDCAYPQLYATCILIYIYVMRKVRIRTIRGFCCANLGSELLSNNPRIAHANHESARNLLGSRNQTSAIRGNKPTIDVTK